MRTTSPYAQRSVCLEHNDVVNGRQTIKPFGVCLKRRVWIYQLATWKLELGSIVETEGSGNFHCVQQLNESIQNL